MRSLRFLKSAAAVRLTGCSRASSVLAYTVALGFIMVAVQTSFDFGRRGPQRKQRSRQPAASGNTARADIARADLAPAEIAIASAPAPGRRLHVAAADLATQERAFVGELESALRARVAIPLRLTVTDNRRTMLSLRRRAQFVEVRLHRMFLAADAPTRDALGDYLFDGDRGAAQCIARYIERHRKEIRRSERRGFSVSTAGAHHDLAEIYEAVNARYFESAVDAHITWGRAAGSGRRRARRSIKLGSYTSRDRLIRVHPALDAAFVPRLFVEYIVYHEMLHQVIPPKSQRGRRDLHGPNFKARERQFIGYAEALRWEHEHLDQLLRSTPSLPPRGKS
jgi:hypothetical protein